MRPKLATSTTTAKSTVPTLSPLAPRRTRTKETPATGSAAIRRWGRSWTEFPRSSATGCSSAPVSLRVAPRDAGRLLCLIVPIKTRRNQTVWSYGGSAVRMLSAGKERQMNMCEFCFVVWRYKNIPGQTLLIHRHLTFIEKRKGFHLL